MIVFHSVRPPSSFLLFFAPVGLDLTLINSAMAVLKSMVFSGFVVSLIWFFHESTAQLPSKFSSPAKVLILLTLSKALVKRIPFSTILLRCVESISESILEGFPSSKAFRDRSIWICFSILPNSATTSGETSILEE